MWEVGVEINGNTIFPYVFFPIPVSEWRPSCLSRCSEKWQYKLRPKVVLDREAQKFYELPFRTEDREGVSGTRYLTIEVGDVNDSPMTDGSSAIQVYNYQVSFCCRFM